MYDEVYCAELERVTEKNHKPLAEESLHLDDEAYANFRAVNTTGMGTDTLFRSSSLIDPVLNLFCPVTALI